MIYVHPDIAIPSFLDEREIADPLRLRRERARWPGLDDAPPTSRIVVLEHGGRARPVIHRGSRHRRSRLTSLKTRRLQITEGNGLPFLCRTWEVTATCADWEAHPFAIHLVFDGEALVWYPDGVFVDFGGPPTLVEVKRTIADLSDREYAAKLGAMAELARRIGWAFAVRYDVDIFGSEDVRRTRMANVQSTYSRRFLRLSASEERAVDALVAAGREVTWRQAGNVVAAGDPLRGDAVIECAIARGRLLVDFDAPRSGITPVRPFAARAAPAKPVVYPKPEKPWRTVSYTTFWRVKRKTRSSSTVAAGRGDDAAAAIHGGGGRMEPSPFFGAIVGIDDSPAPVLCKLEAAGLVWVGRPTLTIARDRHVGGFVGRDLSWDHPSSSTVLRTLLDVGTPKRVPEDMRRTHPQLAMFCCNPVRVVVDNLAAHHHQHVEDSLREIGADIDFTGAGKPRDKADVESGVGVVMAALFDCAPGAVDAIPLRRHDANDPPADELPTLDGLRKLLDRGLATLNMSPTSANMNRSPLARLASSLATRKPGIIEDRARLAKAIGMVVYDVELRASGLELFKCLRFSEAKGTRDLYDRLCHLVRPSKRTKVDSVRVKVKYDAGDIGRVQVWDPTIKDWVTLECDQPDYANRLPEFIHEQILKDIEAAEGAFVSPSTLLEYRARLFEEAVEIQQAADASERRRAANVIQSPIFRMHLGEYVEVVDEDGPGAEATAAAFAGMETTSGIMRDWDRPTPRPERRAPAGAGKAEPWRAGRAKPAGAERGRRDAGREADARPARPRSAANRGLRTS